MDSNTYNRVITAARKFAANGGKIIRGGNGVFPVGWDPKDRDKEVGPSWNSPQNRACALGALIIEEQPYVNRDLAWKGVSAAARLLNVSQDLITAFTLGFDGYPNVRGSRSSPAPESKWYWAGVEMAKELGIERYDRLI